MILGKAVRLSILVLVTLLTACTTVKQISSVDESVDAETTSRISTETSAYALQCEAELMAISALLRQQEEITEPFSVETVLVPLNNLQISLSNGARLASTYKSVHPDPDLRKAATDCLVKYSDIGTQLSLSRATYDAVSKVDVHSEPADTQRFHELTLRGFRLSGVDKDEKTRKRIRALNDEITQIGQTWDKNILDDVRYIEVTTEELKGLPQDYIDAHPADENGLIKISTRYPDIYPVYTFAESDEVRRRLRQQERSRAYPQNEPVLKALLDKRY
jgi:thimet oligopeptidase